MLELDVPAESVLGTVEFVAVRIGTGHFLQNVFVTSSVHFFGVLGLSFFNFSNLLEHFQHYAMFLFGLFDLLLQEGLPFGEEGQFFGIVDGSGHEDVGFRIAQQDTFFLMGPA
jgi:uncharacterized membrane protein YhfC